jgi:hypothetical protein
MAAVYWNVFLILKHVVPCLLISSAVKENLEK